MLPTTATAKRKARDAHAVSVRKMNARLTATSFTLPPHAPRASHTALLYAARRPNCGTVSCHRRMAVQALCMLLVPCSMQKHKQATEGRAASIQLRPSRRCMHHPTFACSGRRHVLASQHRPPTPRSRNRTQQHGKYSCCSMQRATNIELHHMAAACSMQHARFKRCNIETKAACTISTCSVAMLQHTRCTVAPPSRL
jgi:hypothetical protein